MHNNIQTEEGGELRTHPPCLYTCLADSSRTQRKPRYRPRGHVSHAAVIVSEQLKQWLSVLREFARACVRARAVDARCAGSGGCWCLKRLQCNAWLHGGHIPSCPPVQAGTGCKTYCHCRKMAPDHTRCGKTVDKLSPASKTPNGLANIYRYIEVAIWASANGLGIIASAHCKIESTCAAWC